MPVEQQTAFDMDVNVWVGSIPRAGQRLTIPGRIVTKLAFVLDKFGSPTGDVYFVIRRVSDDSVIISEVALDVGSLDNTPTWCEHEFSSPTVEIDEEVRIAVEVGIGDATNYLEISVRNANVKSGESHTYYVTDWGEIATRDCAYKYTWEEPAAGLENKSANMAAKLVAAGLI